MQKEENVQNNVFGLSYFEALNQKFCSKSNSVQCSWTTVRRSKTKELVSKSDDIVSETVCLDMLHPALCEMSAWSALIPFTGECCVALRSLNGASEQFETFLSHRGEEMGSIRGRVRIHVPKDRRGTREKVYGGSGGRGLFLPSALLALSLPATLSSPLSLHPWLSYQSSLCFLYVVPQWSPGLALHLLVSIVRFLFWLLIGWPDASWDTEKGQMSVLSQGQAQKQHT